MSPYTENTTGDEVADDCRDEIANKTILVTGATPKGLGARFSITVAKYQPACIILATRQLVKAQETAKEIAAVAPSVRVRSVGLDLGSIESVRKGAEQIESFGENIDVIVNNAGIMASPYAMTTDGIERQFGTNHIGHFLLTNLLLSKALTRKVPLRVVNVSSGGYRYGPVRFEDYNFDDGNTYNRWIAYAQSKTANLLFSQSLAKKLGKQGLVSVSLHPGVIVDTSLSRDLAWEDFKELGELDRAQGHRRFWGGLKMKTPEQGIATHIFAAFHPSLASPDLNGSYLADSTVVKAEDVLCWGRDAIDAERLWKLSEELVSQRFEY